MFAYNSDKQLLYKINNNDTMAVIYDEIEYSAAPNRQMRLDASGNVLFLQTGSTEITAVGDLESDNPKVIGLLNHIPGDKIIDFHAYGDSALVVLSGDGFVSCFSFNQGMNMFRLLAATRVPLQENEVASSLAVSTYCNKIFIATLRLKDNITLQRSITTNAMNLVQYSEIEIHAFNLEQSGAHCNIRKIFTNPFKVSSRLNESEYPIEMSTNHTVKGEPMLFMMINKDQSEAVSFIVEEDRLEQLTNLRISCRTSKYQFLDNSLWIFEKTGMVKIYI